jgi:hypothetical protein
LAIGDKQVGGAGLIGEIARRWSGHHLRAPWKVVHHRQGRPEFRFDSRHTRVKFVEFVAARLAGANGHARGVH